MSGFNPLTAKLFYWNSHPLEDIENYSDLPNGLSSSMSDSGFRDTKLESDEYNKI